MRDCLTVQDAFNLNEMRDAIGRFNAKQGWRDKSDKITAILENVDPSLVPVFQNYLAGTMIALLHSELSEALEGLRKNLMDDHLTDRKMVEAEMADVFIRLLDFCDTFNIDIGGVVKEKDLYNHSREDHKKENREKEGGKKF